MVVVRLGRANLTWSDAAFLRRLLDGHATSQAKEVGVADEGAE